MVQQLASWAELALVKAALISPYQCRCFSGRDRYSKIGIHAIQTVGEYVEGEYLCFKYFRTWFGKIA